MSNSRIDTVPSSYLLSDLVVVRAVTPVHAGIGRTGGVIDLPIQRDEYGYPCIYSSSLKGSLKTALLYALLKLEGNYDKAKGAVQVLLGPEPEEGESFESSIAILDAYLFAMPVRSLKGVYTYITSPLLLRRFYERLELLTTISQKNEEQKGEQAKVSKVEMTINTLRKIIEEILEPGKAICVGEDKECKSLKVDVLQGKIILVEEYFLDFESLGDTLTKELNIFIRNEIKLDKPLLIVDDSIGKNIIDRSILRFTRVRLNRGTKTVKEGPWTEEYLPPKTVLHSIALYKKPSLSSGFVKKVLGKEKKQGQLSEDEYLKALMELRLLNDNHVKKIKNSGSILEKMQVVAKAIREKTKDIIDRQLKGYIILGGHETIGKGIVKLKLLNSEEPEKTLKGVSR